jgi:hypothetical protein
MRLSFRAFPAIWVMAALVLGLLSSGFPSARASASASSERFVACHQFSSELYVAAGRAEAHSRGHDTGKHGSFAGCPDCCLAAHAGAAVLPEREPAFARPLRAAVARIRYSSVSEGVTNSAPIAAANGARAPPAA